MNVVFIDELRKYKVRNILVINDNTNSPSLLNKYVRQIYVINMEADTRKRNYIQLLFKKYNINYNLVIVDKVDDDVYNKLFQYAKLSVPELGCTMSHMWCLIHMLKNEFENAIIFEDDVIFSKTFIEDFINIINSHTNLDFLLLGAHDFNFSRKNYKNVKGGLYRPEFDEKFPLYGAHANYYSYRGAKRMFYIRSTNPSFFDNEYNLIFDTLPYSYICYPNLAIANMSESGISSTHKKDFFSQYEYTYYNCCFKDINFTKYNLFYTNILDPSIIPTLNDRNSVNEFIDKCLAKHLDDPDKITIIKKRFTPELFSMNEIMYLLSN